MLIQSLHIFRLLCYLQRVDLRSRFVVVYLNIMRTLCSRMSRRDSYFYARDYFASPKPAARRKEHHRHIISAKPLCTRNFPRKQSECAYSRAESWTVSPPSRTITHKSPESRSGLSAFRARCTNKKHESVEIKVERGDGHGPDW